MPFETADIRPPPPVEIQNQIHQQLSLDPAAAAAAAPITMQPPKPTDLLPCPRCGSGSTKFCYYNNYNLSQPRYFCKGCRRYWTQGGTLRCVPVGGGSRKNASSYSASKRSRSSSASSTATTASTNSSNSTGSNPTVQEPAPVSASGSELIKVENNNSTTTAPYGLNLNEKFEPVITDSTGNFMSLLNCQETPMLGMNGYGSGFGYGFYDMGLGYSGRVGPSIWSYPGIVPGHVADGAAGVTGVTGGDANPGCNAWQVGHDVGGGGGNGGGAGGGVVDDGGDYFSWPGLAIFTPGKTFK